MSFKIVKTFEIFCDKSMHEYTLEVSEDAGLTKYELKASETEEWANDIKGKTLMVAVNDGNQISFSKNLGKNLDFVKAEHVRIILHIENVLTASDYPSKRAIETERKMTISL